MLLQLKAAGILIEADPPVADAVLTEVKGVARAEVGDIRRLVYELRRSAACRPPSRWPPTASRWRP
jgi:signal transduction histidine kinase